jgi:hypothetical protein
MKKIYLTTTLTLAAVIGFAQSRIQGTVSHAILPTSTTAWPKIAPSAIMTNGCDTVWNILPTDTAALYGAGATPQWGYVSGTNSYGDIGKAEKILSTSYTAGYKLTAAAFFFGKAVDGGTATTMTVRAWDNTGTGATPGATLGTPVNLPIASMATGGTPTLVSFAPSFTVTSDFYIGIDGFVIDAPNPQQDTVAIYQSTSIAGHAALAYDEFGGGGGWVAESDPSNWSNSSDFYIVAILCSPTLGDVQIVNPTPEVLVYPNPSNGNVYVSTGSAIAGNVSISVIDALGKVVSSSNQYIQKGTTAKVEMNNAAAGVYFMNITTAGKTVTKKLIIE